MSNTTKFLNELLNKSIGTYDHYIPPAEGITATKNHLFRFGATASAFEDIYTALKRIYPDVAVDRLSSSDPLSDATTYIFDNGLTLSHLASRATATLAFPDNLYRGLKEKTKALIPQEQGLHA